MIRRWLSTRPFSLDLGLLLLRVGTAALMLTHGWPKLQRFPDGLHSFRDPIGLGSEASFVLTIFAEFFCSVLVILGLWTRFALVPLIITMGVVVFVVHGEDPFKNRELPTAFLLVFTSLWFTGPGKFSVDHKLYR